MQTQHGQQELQQMCSGIEAELAALNEEERRIDVELNEYFALIAGAEVYSGDNDNGDARKVIPPRTTNDVISTDIRNCITKIGNDFGPLYEAMQQDARKMTTQIEECRALSERLSRMVRRLDMMQMRAHETLACTEDIINLKDCKARIINAIESHNLAKAVGCLRQVHEIDLKAAATSDDYAVIQEKEEEIKQMVQKEFSKAIADSDLSAVMGLCPLLQTLGLESEARDTFLNFMESNVFIAVSADAAVAEDRATVDPAAAYAQALSSVFNSAYLIIQKYLPFVIQGMDSSLGDIHFIRRLHRKCESESGLVLKRYMKFRNIREVLSTLRVPGSSTGNTAAGSGAQTAAVSIAELHSIMDELALLVQYCCKYSKYLTHICLGAETKVRQRTLSERTTSTMSEEVPETAGKVTVFAGPSAFDKMVDELLNRYYLEGERWLMRQGVHRALPATAADSDDVHLDECFFVLQKCGLRSIATNNIQAACAVLHLISDLLSGDLLQQANAMLNHSIGEVKNIMQEHINRFKSSIRSGGDNAGTDGSAGAGGLSKGFISLASSITGAVETSVDVNGVGIQLQEEGGFSLVGAANSSRDDPWGTASHIETFNIIELCVRYTERLTRDISAAGNTVFNDTDVTNGSATTDAVQLAVGSTAADKLHLCIEDFDAAKISFSNALRQGAEKLSAVAKALLKDIFTFSIGRQAPLGGLRFDETEARFDQQPALNLLPRILTLPVETLINICTFNLSDRSKDLVVGLLVSACCEQLEHFITQMSFRFTGAVKMEEIVRTLNALFSRHSLNSVRSRFSRLREVMMVLTTDNASAAVAENYSLLTAHEVDAFLALRVDMHNA